MIDDPAKSALLRYYYWTIQRRRRAEELLARRIERERQALAQLNDYRRDVAVTPKRSIDKQRRAGLR